MLTTLRHLPRRITNWAFPKDLPYSYEELETVDLESEQEEEFEECPAHESRLEEAYLKRILLKFLVDEELRTIAEEPAAHVHQKTILLSFLYRQFLWEFPPFKKHHHDSKHKLDLLMNEYPRWVIMYKSATKDEPTSYRNLINFFDMMIRTPGEVQAEHNDEPHRTDILNARRESLLAFHSMLKDNKLPDGSIDIKKLLAPFIECSHIRQLPPNYQKLFGFVHRKYGPIIQLKLVQNHSKLRKVRMIYSLCPIRAMKAILAVANPGMIVHGFIRLLFAKPFGGKNLLQRVLMVATDVHKTENQILQLKESLRTLQGNEELEATLEKLELRRKDKSELIELFGDDQLIEVLKDCFPFIYGPLFELYTHADTSTLLDQTFLMVKHIIDIALSQQEILKATEDHKTVNDRFQRIYTQELMQYEQSLFMFFKSMLNRPESRQLLEEILEWLFGTMLRFQLNNSVIDVKRMMHELPHYEHDLVAQELQEYTQFKINKAQQRKKVAKASLASTPKLQFIPKFMSVAFKNGVATLFKN